MRSMPRSSSGSQNRDPAAFSAASVYAECMKSEARGHACRVAGKRGAQRLSRKTCRRRDRFRGEQGEPAARKGPVFSRTLRALRWNGQRNCTRNRRLLSGSSRNSSQSHPDSRIIIFATYRDTVQLLVDFLTTHGIACERFVGQATKDAEKGLSQKKQIAALTRFRGGGVQGPHRNIGRRGRPRCALRPTW